jgi:hypothetical protein
MTQWEIQLKPQFHVSYLNPLALWQPEVPLGNQGMTNLCVLVTFSSLEEAGVQGQSPCKNLPLEKRTHHFFMEVSIHPYIM